MFSIQGLLGIHPKHVSPLRAVQTNNDKAYLLIHSENDEKIPYQESVDLYEQIGSKNKELWLTKDALHVRSYKVLKEEYEQRIFQFLSQYL
jgi:esterase/lipase